LGLRRAGARFALLKSINGGALQATISQITFIIKTALILLFSILVVQETFASQVELLRCVEELKTIRSEDTTTLEFQLGLAIGATSFKNSQQKSELNLLVANERGVFAFPILRGKINYLQVEIPHPDPRRKPRLLFLAYSHSDVYGSRLLGIDWDLPPQGRAPSQYKTISNVGTVPSERQFQQLIAEELKRLSDLYRRGELGKADLLAGNLSLCRRLGSQDQKLSEWLNRQIGELELVSSEQKLGSRLPASN